MAPRQGVFSTSVGTKLVIGLSGLLLFGYLLIHIAGNFVVFLGPAAFNKYAFTLESQAVLPVIPQALLALFAVPIYKSVELVLSNQRFRPVAYAKKRSAGYPTRKTFASTTMISLSLWMVALL